MDPCYFRSRRLENDPSVFQGDETCRDTWAGPINKAMYGRALQDLCARTEWNLKRLSHQMEKIDPCLEFGARYWHAKKRPASAGPRIQREQGDAKWENLDVMFTDYEAARNLSSTMDEGKGDYIDPPVPVNRFCYLCSTMEEHKKHLLHHKPAKRPGSAKPRLLYIAPKPKVKRKKEEEEEIVVKERLYKVEVFTSDIPNAGTSAKVFITIKGSLEILPRTQLVKKRGCANFCFVRASKEVFHLMGPLLGNLQTLTIEHDGRKKFHGWHLEKIEVTDVKALKTWVFNCGEWLSMFEKPHFTNIMDLKAEEKHMPLAEYNIEVYTGKKQMAGTDANIYIVISGENGSSRKVHLADNTQDKKLFEKNSVDKFRIRMHSLGNLHKIRIEHDGKGLGAGWFLDRIIIKDSTRPKDTFYFLYNGWIAKDEGEGKLWREIKAKKVLPKEVQHGIKTQYNISVKTSDIRFAGTDANVFIQIAGVNGGITPKLKLDDAKNNFERNMVDNFEVQAVNVGVIDHIVIGHDNFGPGAGWHLESVTIRRYVPKDEAKERIKKAKKRLKKEKKSSNIKNQLGNNSDYDSDDIESDKKERLYKDKRGTKDKKLKAGRKTEENKKRDLFSVSSESSDEESDTIKESRGRSKIRPKRPGSALRRQSESSGERKSPILERSDSRRSSSVSNSRQPSSTLSQSLSERRASTSASSLRKREDEENRQTKKGRKRFDDDDNLGDTRIPLYEEYLFMCNRWLAANEDDGLFVRELSVTDKTVYYKE